ncbi:MAG: cysteine desulfurase family protein [Candidatus Paceibacterota bacterium]|jgi:cysteine desulfurase
MFSIFSKKRNYFDYASTTPLDKRVFKAMKPYLVEKFANSSSLYKEGVETGKALTESRRVVASVLQVKPDEIIFTGGGTESNNLAILGTYFSNIKKTHSHKSHFVTTTIEHSSVLEVFRYIEKLGGKVSYVAPESNGIVDVKKIEEAITSETVLVSVMYSNNEIGTIQPIREIGKIIKAKKDAGQNIVFHVDACQGALYLSLLAHELLADFVTLDSSKFYGPKGVGILYKKRNVSISPIIFGGGQEGGLRSGTENIPGIVGFAEALRIAGLERESQTKHLSAERDRIIDTLIKNVPGIMVNGDRIKRLPNNINICVPNLDAEYAVLRLDVLGFAVSSVTTCKTLSEDSSSYVVKELYGDETCSRSSLRITLGRFTTKREVNALIKALLTILKR